MNIKERTLYIHIDGRGTQTDPFFWPPSLKGVYKKLSLEAYHAVAHITGGTSGMDFISIDAPSNETGNTIALSGLVFHGTKLKLSNYSEVFIHNCTFVDSKKSITVLYLPLGKTFVSLTHTNFRNNSRCLSVVPFKTKKKTSSLLTIDMQGVSYTQNGFYKSKKAWIYSAVNIMKSSYLYHRILVKLRDVHFSKNVGSLVKLSNAEWKLETGKKYKHQPHKFGTILVISNCTFRDNLSPRGVLYLMKNDLERDLLNITSTSFLSNTVGFKASDNFYILCTNMTMNFTTGKGIVLQNSFELPNHFRTFHKQTEMHIALIGCVFGNNANSLQVENIKQGKHILVQIQDSIFYGNHPRNKYDSTIDIQSNIAGSPFSTSKRDTVSSRALIYFRRVKIQNNRGKSLFVVMTSTNVTLKFLESEFDYNNNYKSSSYKGYNGPVMYIRISADKRLNSSFLSNPAHSQKELNTHTRSSYSAPRKRQTQSFQISNKFVVDSSEPSHVENKYPQNLSWDYNDHILFENTHFRSNIGFGGIVMLRDGKATFINCSFQDNIPVRYGGTITVTEGSAGLGVYNSTFLRRKSSPVILQNLYLKQEKLKDCFITFQGEAALTIHNTSFVTDSSHEMEPIFEITSGGSVRVDEFSSFECPIGKELRFENFHRVANILCRNSSCIVDFNSTTLYCQECARNWYSLQRGRSIGLALDTTSSCLPCPFGANCLKTITARSNFWGYRASDSPSVLRFIHCPHNYCHGNRRMYNSCYGNREGLLCGECKQGYTEDLFSTKCRPKRTCHDSWFWPLTALITFGMTFYLVFKPPVINFLYKKAFWFRNHDLLEIEQNETKTGSGFLKVIFYFYQIAELLLMKPYKGLLEKMVFIAPVMAFFDFQLIVLSNKLGCPFPGITVVTKELFLSLNVIATIICLLPIFIFNYWFNRLRGHSKPSVAHYSAVAVEVLLLGYDRLADVSLKLLRCVQIGDSVRLFYNANIQCWQWWQFVFLAFVAIFILPFMITLYWGSIKIHKNELSNKEFIGACCVPLPFIIYWSINRYRRNTLNTYEIDKNAEMKKILHEPFKPPTENSSGTLHWESILIGRRFLLVCLHSFIIDPMIRIVCLDCACAIILMHHLLRKPYKDTKVNSCETFSLLALIMIATFSVAEATLVSIGADPVGPTKEYIEVLQWIKLVLLSILPAGFCLLVIFATLSQTVRLSILVVKMRHTLVRNLHNCCHNVTLTLQGYRAHARDYLLIEDHNQ